jgi:hypothetical protein
MPYSDVFSVAQMISSPKSSCAQTQIVYPSANCIWQKETSSARHLLDPF